MFSKCSACGARIIAGGETYLSQPFCSADCLGRFKISLTERLVPSEVVDKQVQDVFASPCPECGRQANNDLYRATRISAFLLFFRIESQQRISCATCGRKHRLLAALHCLFAGWWGPKAAFCNLFVLPANLIAAAFIRTPSQPSPALRALVKARIAESLVPQLLAAKTGDTDQPAGSENS